MIKINSKYYPLIGIVSALALLIMFLFAYNQPKRAVTGDEPSYLIMAQSLIIDRDFDLKNNVLEKTYLGGIVPYETDPHVFHKEKSKWYSIHNIGLPIIISPVLAIWGTVGAIILMILLSIASLFAVYWLTYRTTLNKAVSFATTIMIGVSCFYFTISGSIFPDLPTAGIVVVSIILLIKKRLKTIDYAIVSTLSCTLVYLHFKNSLLALSIFLIAGFLLLSSKHKSWKDYLGLLTPIVILGLLFSFKMHQWHGQWIPIGVFSNGQMWYFFPGKSILAGLVDFSRGLLFLNPTFLLIFSGLYFWYKKSKQSLCIVLLVILPSAIIQSTFNDWAGGFSPAGRYLSFALLALSPAIGFSLMYLNSLFERIVISCLFLYQIVLIFSLVLSKSFFYHAGERSPIFSYIDGKTGFAIDKFAPKFDVNLHFIDYSSLKYLVVWVIIICIFIVYGIIKGRRISVD